MALARQLLFATPALLLWLLAAAAVSSAADYYDFTDVQDYGAASKDGMPIYDKSLPSYGNDMTAPLGIAVEGVVSCKNGTKYHPLKGKLVFRYLFYFLLFFFNKTSLTQLTYRI